MIENQVLDRFENPLLRNVWYVSDEEQLWIERKIQNRKDWKNLLRIYLRLSYIQLLKDKTGGDCEFLMYQPFGNIKKEMNENGELIDILEVNGALSEMENPVLVHGYRESEGKVRILSWERPDFTIPKEVSYSSISLEEKTLYLISGDKCFKQLVELLRPYNPNIHDIIQTQEFTIPNRIFKVKARKSYMAVCELSSRLLTLQNCPSTLLIYTKPVHSQHVFSIPTLIHHFPFYHDLLSLISLSWFLFKYNDQPFRHGQEMLSLPFRHPTLVGHDIYQYAYFAGFVALYLIYGGAIASFSSLLPGFISVIVNVLLRYYLSGVEYPEYRELRSAWNLLSVLELGNFLGSIASAAKLGYKIVLWGKTWKNSILEYFKTSGKEKEE